MLVNGGTKKKGEEMGLNRLSFLFFFNFLFDYLYLISVSPTVSVAIRAQNDKTS